MLQSHFQNIQEDALSQLKEEKVAWQGESLRHPSKQLGEVEKELDRIRSLAENPKLAEIWRHVVDKAVTRLERPKSALEIRSQAPSMHTGSLNSRNGTIRLIPLQWLKNLQFPKTP